MGHAIETSADGSKSAFLSAHTDAWHQLGTTLDHAFTAEEAMKQGFLGGWDVRKQPMWTEGADGSPLLIPNQNAVVRNNPFEPGQIDVLGQVGDGYHIVQNEGHAQFLNDLVEESGAHFDTAGSLYGGKVVFITMKMPGHINVGGVDQVDNYIATMNSHDGSMAFTTMVTPVRVVCANTMNLAFQNNKSVHRIRHTSGIGRTMGQAREALEITFKYLDAFQEEADRLINTTLTQSRFEQIIQDEFGVADDAPAAVITRSENKIEQITSLFADSMTHEGVRETAWAGLNALTEWSDHFAPTRGDDVDNARAQKALLDPWIKNRALSLMLAEV